MDKLKEIFDNNAKRDEYMTLGEFRDSISELDAYRVCKNCKKYEPISDYDLLGIEEFRITNCEREHPYWGCKSWEDKEKK